MLDKKPTRLRVSLRILIAAVTIVALGLGCWIAYANHKMRQLVSMRQSGAIVVFRDGTPNALKSIGIVNLSPFLEVPNVELYVMPLGDSAVVGNSDVSVPVDVAKHVIRDQASTARSLGAKDVQLIQIDRYDPAWQTFADENSLTTINESKPRYLKRLNANQETGANTNP